MSDISPVWYARIEVGNLVALLNKQDVYLPDSVAVFSQDAAFHFVQPTEMWAALFIKKGIRPANDGTEEDTWMAARTRSFKWEHSALWQKDGWLIYFSVPFEVDQLQLQLAQSVLIVTPFLPAFTMESDYITGRDRVEVPRDVPLFQSHRWVHCRTRRPCLWR